MSVTGATRLSLEILRDAVRRRNAKTSIRDLADEIGIGFSGLARFARGETTRLSSANRVKLARWYYRGANASGKPSREDLNLALDTLRMAVEDPATPASVRERLRREFIEGIATVDSRQRDR